MMLKKFLGLFVVGVSVCALPAFAAEDDAEESAAEPAPPPAPFGAPEPARWGAPLRQHLDIGVGYVYSRWSRISPALKDGSLAFRVGGMREFSPSIEGGWNLTMLTGTDNAKSNDNISAVSFGVGAKWMLLPGHITPFAGFGIEFGGYRAWSLQSETPSTVTYEKHANGFLVGVTPSLGARMLLSPRMAVELAATYMGYLDNPASKIGGWGALVSFNFSNLMRH